MDAMDLFPAGGFVRLRSRARDNKYVHADKDGIHVSLRPLGPSLNAVWKVDHWPVHGGGNVILLQGAAYGRYLAVSPEDEAPPPGHLGVRAVQRDYNSENLDRPFAWNALRVEAGQNYVRLWNHLRYLRANGRYLHWNNLVTAGGRTDSTMMQWMVEAIPSTPQPLPLPPPPPPPPQSPIQVRRGLFRRRTGHDVHPHDPGRTIRHARLDNDGNWVGDHWSEFVSYDSSVSNLRTQLAKLLGDENITLGVMAGTNAAVIPLVTDLPNNQDTMQIIVYTTGSPAAAQLRYPQF